MSEEEEKPKATSWYENLSAVRWIFAVFGIFIMIFAGGCSLMVFFDFLSRGVDRYGFNSPLTIMGFGGLPFLFGLLVWWLAAKAGRQSSADDDDQ